MESMACELARALDEKGRPDSHPQNRWREKELIWAPHAERLAALLEAWGGASLAELADAPVAGRLVLGLGLEWRLEPLDFSACQNPGALDHQARAGTVRLAHMAAHWESWPALSRKTRAGGESLARTLFEWTEGADCGRVWDGARRLASAIVEFEGMLGGPLWTEPLFWGAAGGFEPGRPALSDFYGSAICKRMLGAGQRLPLGCLAEILALHAEGARREAEELRRPGSLGGARGGGAFEVFAKEMRQVFDFYEDRPDIQKMLNGLANQFGAQERPEDEPALSSFWLAWAEKLDLAAQAVCGAPASPAPARAPARL